MGQQRRFSKDSSQALKGIAICLMMLHHCFRKESLFDAYAISFYPFLRDWIVRMADMGKICVSLFAFISGYGLYISFKNSRIQPTKWVALRYIKTFSGYWIIWMISAGITECIDGRLQTVFLKKNIYF